jgi:hypothetical protein
MGMENKIINTKPHQEIPQRLWLANEANLRLAVGQVRIEGKENIKGIPPGAKVVVLTTHLNDLSVPAAIHALGRDLDLVVTNQSIHHEFGGGQGEIAANIGMRVAGKGNFIAIDYERNKEGEKSPKAFNPENFQPMIDALDKGKSIIMAAHNPTKEALPNLDGVKGGYGGVYLAELADAYILPVTVTLSQDVMDSYNLKTLLNKPDAFVIIGKPFKLEKIPGIERFAELTKKREDEGKLNDEERIEFSGLAHALREKSLLVMKQLSEQLLTDNG